MRYAVALFKGSVLAVLVTLFVQRAVEWQKGLTSEFIVYGQSGVPGPGWTSKAIPELAVGTVSNVSYSMTIQIVNSGGASATVSGIFYNEDGSTFTLPMTITMNASAPVTFTGGFTRTLAANSILVIGASAASAVPAVMGWGQISSSTPITINALLNIRDTAGTLLSRIGVAPSAIDMERFVIPRLSNVESGPTGLISQTANVIVRDTGLAIANTGPTSGVLNATLISATGAMLATRSIIMGPHTHQSIFAHDLFDLTESGISHAFITFESFSPQWAATAIAVEGSVFASTVVDKID